MPDTATVHLVSQKKGGVGKSVVASWLAQYLSKSGHRVTCFDTDPSNQTFGRIKALQVIPVSLLEDAEIKPGLLDGMIETILDVKGEVVVDTGASGFYALWNYIAKNNLFALLQEEKVSVMIHIPIAPRPDFEDTVAGFVQMAELSPNRSVVIWLNQKQTKAEVDLQTFFDLPLVRSQEQKVRGTVVNVRQRYELHREAVASMLLSSQTFDEAIQFAPLVVRSRLQQVRSEVNQQLEALGL